MFLRAVPVVAAAAAFTFLPIVRAQNASIVSLDDCCKNALQATAFSLVVSSNEISELEITRTLTMLAAP